MSKFSPGVVQADETLARFVFSPLHVGNNGVMKPSVFSHVATKGCSIQRDTLATTDELIAFVTEFLTKGQRQAWYGVLISSCRSTRAIKLREITERVVCVFDTAEAKYPAHAEICQTHHIKEADGPELRKELFAAFGNGVAVKPANYRAGIVWNGLSSALRRPSAS